MTSLHVLRRPALLQMIRDLCDGGTHREPYTTHHGATIIIQYHVTVMTPLITQLLEASEPSSSAEAGAIRPATSKPAARLDAIDTAIRIDHAAVTWLNHLGWYPDNHHTTIDNIRHLASLTPNQDHDTTRTIEADIRRWWTWARIITGWDTPAWAPANTCPLCGTRGTLRIRLDQHIATCTEDTCRQTWDHQTIGLLADHIRLENGEAS